jgi:hypothetical protein
MAQIAALVDTLKSVLKSNAITYATVAKSLDRSESSVKRKFSRQEFSLAELDRICVLAGIDFMELVKTMERNSGRLQQLTADQEKQIADDLGLMLVTVCVLNRWSFDQLIDFYVFDEHELVQMLAKLDRLGLVELLPGNRIKVLAAPNFGWLSNGPIETMFLRVIQKDFFATRFDRADHELIVLNGMLSQPANAELIRRLKRLARDFDGLNQEDTGLAFEDRKGYTLLLAIRDWRYAGFDPYRDEEPA